jgi:hypothetical protein
MQNNMTPSVAEAVDERQSNKFDYVVEQVPFHLPNGSRTRFLANVRQDTGEVLGCVTEQYEILQNSRLFDTCETLFGNKGFKNYTRKAVVTHGGARARAIYDFKDIGVRLNGQDLTFRLKVQNSFDGSLRASFAVGLFRLICSNGLAVPVNAIGMTKKHMGELDADFVAKGFDNAVKVFHDSVPALAKMADTRISQNDGKVIYENLVKRKVLSERMSEGIIRVWDSPTHAEDRERNLWNLYNAATEHLTHSVEGKRFELAERTNMAVLSALSAAVKNDSVASLLVKLN